MDQTDQIKFIVFFLMYKWVSQNVSKCVYDSADFSQEQKDLAKDLLISYIMFNVIKKYFVTSAEVPSCGEARTLQFVLPEIDVD